MWGQEPSRRQGHVLREGADVPAELRLLDTLKRGITSNKKSRNGSGGRPA